jgi:hypothetical protein
VPDWIVPALLALNLLLLLWLAAGGCAAALWRDADRRTAALCCPRPTNGAWPRCARRSTRGWPSLQEGNEKKLEQMRATVDEKLHATLEQRLGESFKQVADRLDQVHKGLGEMQTLARDVGSLNRVLTNVKTRGVFGEVQLAGAARAGLHARAVRHQRGHGAGSKRTGGVRASGCRAGTDGPPLWLPIDAKFPREDYERLLDAHERADAPRRGRGQGHRDPLRWRRAASATSTSRRRTPPTSRSCSCPPRACTPKPCAGPA